MFFPGDGKVLEKWFCELVVLHDVRFVAIR